MFRLLKRIFCKHKIRIARIETYQDWVGPEYSVRYEKCKNCDKEWQEELPYTDLKTPISRIHPLPESAEKK